MRTPKPTEELFWAKVDKTGECWVWTASRNNFGYGRMGISIPKRGWELAHRLSWKINIGTIPEGMQVLHHCDNPACVKTEGDERWPDGHLFLGTQSDNIRDLWDKGRRKSTSFPLPNYHGEATPMAKLKEADIPEILRLRAEGKSYGWIGRQYGVTHSAIYGICSGRSWRHITRPPQ